MNSTRTFLRIVLACIACIVFAGSVNADDALGIIDVNSQPNAARVLLNGEYYGTTPVTMDVPLGRHLITVKLSGYMDEERTIAVAKGSVSAAEDFILDAITGLILVETEPAGALVKINDAEKGKSPLLLTDLKPGNYRFTFSKKGFLSANRDIEIKDRTPQKVYANLRTDSAAISFTSIPEGSAVMINGTTRGTTPCTLDGLNPGKTEFILKQNGFRPFHKAIILRSGDTLKLNAVLQPLPANLIINSIPSGAYVYINNQRRGKTPATMAGLAPGEYRVRVERSGYDAMARTVKLTPASDLSEEFRMSRTSGGIELNTRPAGVRVLVDGRDVGATSAEAGASIAVSQSLKIDPLKPGTHRVTLSRRGYETKVLTIHVTKGRTAVSEHSLRRHVLVRTRGEPEETHIGYLEKLYQNGDVRIEIKKDVFRTFNKTQVKAIEPYVESLR